MNFIKKLWGDRRGNALVLTAGALPLLLGSAGLAADTVQWALWKRQLQRSADSAAIAGVAALVQGKVYSTGITYDLDHKQLWVPLKTGYPQHSRPADTADYNNAVQVSLAVQQRLPFSSFFLANAPTITTTATAALFDSGEFCVVALDNSSTAAAITIGGSTTLNLGCGIISNSRASESITINSNGTGYSVTAEPVAGAGGMPTSINGVATASIDDYHLAQPDPYKDKYPTDVPSGTLECANVNTSACQNADGSLKPGKYTSFNPGGGTTTLSAGTYYLYNTGMSLNGTTNVVGTNVTIIFTGPSPGSLSMNGNADLNLKAPTTGTYANMVMIQSSAAAAGNANTFNGDNGSALDGAVYFPNGYMTFSGSSATSTKCAMIVSLRVTFTGNSMIDNDATDCHSNPDPVMGKKIRLVA